MKRRDAVALCLAAAILIPLILNPASHAKISATRNRNSGRTATDSRPISKDINPTTLKALALNSGSTKVSSDAAARRGAQLITGNPNARTITPAQSPNGNYFEVKPADPAAKVRAEAAKSSGDAQPIAPDVAGMPNVLNVTGALSAGLITTIGGANTQTSEVDLLADWDGREDMTADRAARITEFSPVPDPSPAPSPTPLPPNFTLTRSAISEHTFANGHLFNSYYYGDSVGNLYFGFDLSGSSIIDTLFTANLPAIVNTSGGSGGFALVNPTAGDCMDSQAVVTGIAVNPVADLGDFDPGLCGQTGEVVYVSTLETAGCAANAANQPIRTRIFAFAIFEIGGTEFVSGKVLQVLRTPLVDLAGVAVDDDGNLYFQLIDMLAVDPTTGVGGSGGAIFKATEISRTSCATSGRKNRVINVMPTPSSVNSGQGTVANPVVSNSNVRLTNYSGPSSLFGNIVSLAAGPSNVIYAAVAASNTAGGDPTQGLFKAPATFPNGTPSMVISFADAINVAGVPPGPDTCTSPGVGQPPAVPVGDGFADPAGGGSTDRWRPFVLGNGPDIRTPGIAFANGTPENTLKLDMQIDYTIYSGIAVNEEGSVFVISGGTPAGLGNNPSPNVTEILGFEDKAPVDRRADYVDFRANNFPNPPSSGGNVGDGDSDRFDHIFYQAPKDGLSLKPLGMAGLARGFLRYTNRLAPTPMAPSMTLGVSVPVQGDDATDGTISFDSFDPSHQVAGGDDQNTPFRGDDDGGTGSPADPTSKNGGFEFGFGATSSAIWNGFFLNSNGSVSFGAGDTTATPTVAALRSGPARIGAAWTDLNTNARSTNLGTFPIQALGFANVNAFKIRWINVPAKGSEACTQTGGGASNTFSITLLDDGTSIDENASQPLNPANPIGNNAVPFDLSEGPTDLRFIKDPVTGSVIGVSPRRPGSGNFVNDYGRMDLIGSAAQPVISGYSIGGLSPANPPGLCETNLSEAARSAENSFGIIQGQTASVSNGLIGEGTEGTIYELFNAGTLAAPDFDLRFEGNEGSTSSPAGQPNLNRGSVAFFGVGNSPPATPQVVAITAVPFVTTPTTSGIVNAIGPVTLNIIGSGFYPPEATTVCPNDGSVSPRPGKSVSTSITLGTDINGDSIPEATITLTNIQVISPNLIQATIPAAPGLPGSPFPLNSSGGLGTVTITTSFTAGDNNVFGAFALSNSGQVALGTRAPVVTSVTPSSGNCGVVQTLALVGGNFSFATPGPGTSNVTDVIATDKGNSTVIHASSFTVVDATHLNATFNFAGATGHSFLIQAIGAGGTSRDLTTVPSPPAAPVPGNEAGNLMTFTCGENLQFSAGLTTVTEGLVTAPITITRNNPGAGTVTVDFATSDGSALQKSDYTATFATVSFGPGETSKTVNIPITQDSFPEANETINVTLSNATGGASVGGQSSALLTVLDDDAEGGPNPIDDAADFVGQHYHDFLNRQGDSGGLAFWTSQITSCGAVPSCIEVKRINVSAAFFLSTEFQETGFYVIRIQRAAFGRRSDTAATRYTYLPFLKDAQQVGNGVVIGQPGAAALLEANKQAYATQIVTSAAFASAYPLAQTASQYVDALFASATVTPTTAERNAAITAFGAGGTAGRVAALRSVVETTTLKNAEFNPAFVLLEYYGYLRRNPTDAPDNSDAGYQFWLGKLNAFGGNFVNAEMVKGFITSGEYRQRFGTP